MMPNSNDGIKVALGIQMLASQRKAVEMWLGSLFAENYHYGVNGIGDFTGWQLNTTLER